MTTDLQTDLGCYPVQTPDYIRFNDLDALGHLNNVAIAEMIESSRADLLYKSGIKLAPTGKSVVIANFDINFLAPAHYPGKITTGSAVTRIGGKSFIISAVVYCNDVLIASAKQTMVRYDMDKNLSCAIDDALRKQLEAYCLTS